MVRVTLMIMVMMWLGACATLPAPDASAPSDATAATVPWVHDDYGRALAEARATDRPLVIDFWAPWCHTCLSMQQRVLTDPKILALADRFVWLGVDTDRRENREVVGRFPPQFWPTFLVVSPVDEVVQARFVGSASADTFASFLGQGEAAHRDAVGDGSAEAQVRLGDRASAAGDAEVAARAYAEALAAASPGWDRRCDVLTSRLATFMAREDWTTCLREARAGLDEAVSCRTASAGDFTWIGHYCAGKQDDPSLARAFRAAAYTRLRAVLEDPATALVPDDRSGALQILRELADATDRPEDARAHAEAQRAVLDAACAAASGPEEVMTYGWPRAEVYAYLGVPEQLVGPLRANAAALPDAYDPPYRLAWVLLQAERPGEALVAAEASLIRVYGPRKGRVYGLMATIHETLGDIPAARRAWEGALDVYGGLLGARWEKARARCQAQLRRLSD